MVPMVPPESSLSIREYLNAASWRMEHLFALLRADQWLNHYAKGTDGRVA
jgi:hypothetical protein